MRAIDTTSAAYARICNITPSKFIYYGKECTIKIYPFTTYTYGLLFQAGKDVLCFTDRSINNNQADAVISEIANYLKKVPTGQIKSHRRHLPLVLAGYHVGGNFYKVPEHKMRYYK